jgi:hypothetical protein
MGFRKAILAGWLLGCSGLAACGGGGGDGGSPTGGSTPGSNLNLPPGDGVFTVSPIDVASITRLDPLGWINPPGGHTLPTDHVYFYVNGPSPPTPLINPPPILPVYAPGTGTIVSITTGTTPPFDSSVMIRMTGTFTYYLSHIVPDPAIKVGMVVTAGQQIAHTNGAGGANAVDMGVINEQVTLTGFANPARYLWQQIHCVAPYPYFAEPLRTQLSAMVLRTGTDRNGRIDQDIPGTLQGNWFHESVAIDESMSPAAWPKHLAFVLDPQEPTQQRVSISSFLPLPGKWATAAGSPEFALVTPGSGKVAFPLEYIEGHTRSGLLIVQLIDATHLKVQVFAGNTAIDAAFDGSAVIYSR